MFSKAALFSLILPAYAAVHESLAGAPAGWREASAVADSQAMYLQVAVKYRNLDSLESKLMDVSHPDSANYGKYYEKEDIDALFAPSSDSVDRVKSWLQKSGASHVSSDGSIVTFITTVGEANSMLDSNFKAYTDGKQTKLRTLQYSIPDELTEDVDFLTPTTFFGNMKAHAAIPDMPKPSPVKRASSPTWDPSCLTHIKVSLAPTETAVPFKLLTPTCIKDLYSVGDYTPDASSGSDVAFGSFLNQSANYDDLANWEKSLNLPSKSFDVLALINGGKKLNDQNPSTDMNDEADLDVENIIGLVGDLPVGEYITGGVAPVHPDILFKLFPGDANEPYLPYYQYLLSQPSSKLPWVISNSYGDHENTVPEAYAKRVCNMIGMMGMRGRSILESSGDEGVGAVCLSNNPSGKNTPQFTPQFPGTCPYVTSVGGTQFVNPEHAWNASSGGFSFYFSAPSYQKKAVATYLSNYITSATKDYYSSNKYVDFTGRGFPDVSAHSVYPFYYVFQNGTQQPSGGTSAASPVFAGILALLNDARFRAGLPSLGFVNPWLYKYSDVLNDITAGGSVGCVGVDLQNGIKIPGGGKIPYASWNATVGWDPVTGLGTPNFAKMVAAATKKS